MKGAIGGGSICVAPGYSIMLIMKVTTLMGVCLNCFEPLTSVDSWRDNINQYTK